jgi:hypothetical protein
MAIRRCEPDLQPPYSFRQRYWVCTVISASLHLQSVFPFANPTSISCGRSAGSSQTPKGTGERKQIAYGRLGNCAERQSARRCPEESYLVPALNPKKLNQPCRNYVTLKLRYTPTISLLVALG